MRTRVRLFRDPPRPREGLRTAAPDRQKRAGTTNAKSLVWQQELASGRAAALHVQKRWEPAAPTVRQPFSNEVQPLVERRLWGCPAAIADAACICSGRARSQSSVKKRKAKKKRASFWAITEARCLAEEPSRCRSRSRRRPRRAGRAFSRTKVRLASRRPRRSSWQAAHGRQGRQRSHAEGAPRTAGTACESELRTKCRARSRPTNGLETLLTRYQKNCFMRGGPTHPTFVRLNSMGRC